MIKFLLEIYPDEAFYSYLSRCFVRSGYIWNKGMANEIFDKPTCAIDKCFLNVFTPDFRKLLDEKFSLKNLILNHTLFKYYARFLPLEKRKFALQSAMNNSTFQNRNLPIPQQSSISCLRYCPKCVEEDRLKYSEAYIHLVHTIPDIHTCTKHACNLVDLDLVKENTYRTSFVPLEFAAKKKNPTFVNQEHINFRIAQYITEVFNEPLDMETELIIGNYLSNKLDDKYISPRGEQRNLEILLEDMQVFYKEMHNFDTTKKDLAYIFRSLSHSPYNILLVALFQKIPPADLASYLGTSTPRYEIFDQRVRSIAQSIYHNNYEDNLEFYDKEKTQINLEGKKRRKTGKTIILATMYGMGKKSVALKLDITTDEAEEMLDAFYNQYTGVRKAIDYSISHCKKYGFVEDIYGRKRRLPDIQLPLYETRFLDTPTKLDKTAEATLRLHLEGAGALTPKELTELRKQAAKNNIIIINNEELIKKAERQSFNARIQGSAATLTKMIMVMVDRDPLIKKLGGRIVFQIHDELILDCPIENAEAVRDRLKAIMENSSTAVGVVLPMKCDLVMEERWGEDTMTTELKVVYEELKKDGVENPVEELCKEFCNFPEESIKGVFKKFGGKKFIILYINNYIS